ncbi:MAG: hypothetical protein R6W48_05935 [Gaiellaceae bacterium]
MNRRARGVIQLLALPTVAFVGVLAFLPGRAGVAVRLYAIFLAAVVIGLALGALRRALPPAGPLLETRAVRPPTEAPASLSRLEHEVALAADSAFDYHHRLRRRLRALAEGLLASRRRIALDRDPDAARLALGEATWDLVRDDRPLPDDRLSRGPALAELADAVAALERL